MSTKAMSVAGLVLGIISVAAAWFGLGAVLGLICGIIGLIFAVKAKKAMQATGDFAPKNLATAGLVLSIIGVVLSAIMFVCALCVVCTAATAIGAAGGLDSLYYFI